MFQHRLYPNIGVTLWFYASSFGLLWTFGLEEWILQTPRFCGAWLGFCSMSINGTLGFGVAEASCMRPFNCHD